ncbi:PQQ-binding-like beta-propeller repeat protein [Actinoplanes sp. NPDC049668]|uniref:outer membrane protein assembly factor BamB family protein n=1 Tax=unclassified Actinoplanes TaxID=2626549 RepID=UPI0033A97271
MALIELSTETPAPPAAATPPAAYYRRAGLVLTALLLLALGGAAPARSVLFRRAGSVPLPANGDFQLVGGVLYTMEAAAGRRVLTAWRPAPMRRLWSHTGSTAEDPLYVNTARDPFYVDAATDGFTVLREGRGVTVLDTRTGVVRWTSSGGVQPVDDRLALVEEEIFRPGTEYDPESGNPGQLYGTNTGAPHTEPAQRTELRGVKLATGETQWSLSLPGSVFTTWTGAPENVVVVLTPDKLTVLSPATGTVLRERPMPALDGERATAGEVVGDSVLVYYGTGGPVTAYALDSLAERWRQNQPDPEGNSARCPGLLCTRTSDELIVLDPRTGAERWRIAGTDVVAFGPGAVLEVQAPGHPLRTADAGAGRPRTDLSRWQSYFPVEGGGAYVLSRLERGRGTAFGLLRQDDVAVQPLGRWPDMTVQCHAAPALLACRVPEGIELWAVPR